MGEFPAGSGKSRCDYWTARPRNFSHLTDIFLNKHFAHSGSGTGGEGGGEGRLAESSEGLGIYLYLKIMFFLYLTALWAAAHCRAKNWLGVTAAISSSVNASQENI